MAASESYPEELKYHREHDWARIEGDEATLGITWFAQDALGELVHFEAPAEGSSTVEGRVLRRGRVGQGRLGRDRAALGRDPRGEPEGRRRAGDGERGPLRRGLARPDPALRPVRGRRLLDADAYKQLPRRAVSFSSRSPTADREEMLAAIGVSSVEELFRDIPAGVRFQGELDLEPALSEPELVAAPRGARGEERRHDEGALLPRRRHLRPLRAGRRRRRAPARRVPDRVHAVPAGDEPGRPAGDLRVPDGDLRADRDGRLERVRLRRDDRRRRRLLRREARDRPVEGRARRDARTRRCARS